jgi:hypothetical protein
MSQDELTFDDAETTKILRRHIFQLMEHYDSVSIVVTRYNPETKNTHGRYMGEGNYHARFGAMFNWIEGQRGLMRERESIQEEEQEEESGGRDPSD